MLKVNIKKPLLDCIAEAFSNNAIITSNRLSFDEFIWVRNGVAYYEDGGRLGYEHDTIEFLTTSNWVLKSDWFVVGYLTDDEVKSLDKVSINLDTKDKLKSILSDVITVEDIVARADMIMFSDFEDSLRGIFRTYIVSKSDEPITKEESKLLSKMYRACGKKDKLVFLPCLD